MKFLFDSAPKTGEERAYIRLDAKKARLEKLYANTPQRTTVSRQVRRAAERRFKKEQLHERKMKAMGHTTKTGRNGRREIKATQKGGAAAIT